jgi:hypothetical protein
MMANWRLCGWLTYGEGKAFFYDWAALKRNIPYHAN